MDIKELEKGFYYFIKDGMFIKLKIKQIVESKHLIHIMLDDGYGASMIEVTEKIKIRRPSNMINDFHWCYKLKNIDDECIGYIGLQKVNEHE